MQLVLLLNAIFGLIPALVQGAEALYSSFSGKGAEKKALVLQGVQNGLAIAAVGGNDDAAKPEVQAAINELASNAIDMIVTTYNTVNRAWGKTAPIEGPDV